ncbi:Planctomycete cytochrome C [Planctomycetes bacterium Pan216]|uniref:Planctomycete cytochrome C n=1 Tax=Kolteria novifilia TaxID=2527975 RepID=A0A518B2K0_9BACT|nr:Planctomycete cytochrome C [Planctomycetes bacterium Pan216]
MIDASTLRPFRWSLLVGALAMCVARGSLALEPAQTADERVEFARDIRPIFANHCNECHGADRSGGLRLTSRRDAFTASDSGEVVIKAGHAKQSILLERITSQDEDAMMPPEGDRLSAKEVALINRWIEQGADWPKDDAEGPTHWAYVTPTRPERPDVDQHDWPVNPIDDFVLAALEEKGLRPSPSADPAVLLRRVYLALTGLPPSPEQVDAFVANPNPEAYEAVVDELLNSPRYGERWARPWLDLARYADSNGFQADQLRESWAYRDWVIEALNKDMPFDQFAIEQLAGDLLPNATIDQKIATGFHRTVTCNVEAGVHPEENRVNQLFDRVNTTGTVFLGTTLECCQCHNHKYDPFTQTEYYRLFAYFNNTPLEVKQKSGVTYDFVGPKMSLPLPEERLSKRKQLSQRLEELKAQRRAAFDQQERDAWERELRQGLKSPPEWTVLAIVAFESTGGEEHEILEDQSVLVSGSLPGTTTYTITATTKQRDIGAFKIEALTHPSLPGMGPGRGDELRTNFILSEVDVREMDGSKRRAVPLHGAQADFSQDRWEVANAIDGNPKTGWAIAPQFGKPHWASFRTAKRVGSGEESTFVFTLEQNYGRGRTLGRVRLSGLVGDPGAAELPEAIAKILRKENDLSDEERRLLDKHFAKSNPRLSAIDAEIQKTTRQLGQLQPATTLVMVEMSEPRETRVLLRGDYLNKGSEVNYGTPGVLHPLEPGLPRNRLGLAKWLVDPANPLLPRVTVNRWWAEFFGQGIVSSLEDFGTKAEPPTHPELLDWLAVEFVDGGWSAKHLHKLIVMSRTFRQSSAFTSKHLKVDPENKLYSRGPRFRMSAEMIRDNALAVSGLLATKMGGEPIMPFQPEGIWRSVGRNAPKWVEERDEDRFRRGIYVVWRRAAPYPSFVNFDAPDRAACVVKRPRTNTPLQALTLLNDPAYVEMALALAERIVNDLPDASVERRAAHGLRLCLAREPRQKEIDALVALHEAERQRLRSDPKLARRIVKGARRGGVSDVTLAGELACWFHVASVLLNLDETITRG